MLICQGRAMLGPLQLSGPLHLVAAGPAALATDTVGSFEASGLIFKDSVEVIAQEDPAGGSALFCANQWLLH